ncbi:MAG: Coenzyme F420 hydrogenase/dehydrogenase, beta subunit C-terminal domain, partial [Candidatus Bathyarchaeia archaeon]
VPCKISAIPLIQEHALPPSHEVALTIGLFCSESFTREGFLAAAEKVASVPVERISKIDIKGKLIVSTDDGREVHGSLKDLRDFMDSSCHRCRDYTAEAADISIGSVGAPERGFNVVIVRSERGRQLIQHATADNTITVDPRPMNRELLARLCRKKKGDLGG